MTPCQGPKRIWLNQNQQPKLYHIPPTNSQILLPTAIKVAASAVQQYLLLQYRKQLAHEFWGFLIAGKAHGKASAEIFFYDRKRAGLSSLGRVATFAA